MLLVLYWSYFIIGFHADNSLTAFFHERINCIHSSPHIYLFIIQVNNSPKKVCCFTSKKRQHNLNNLIKCIWFYSSQYYFHKFLNSDSESHPVILIIRHQHFVKCFISFMAEINQKLKFICKTATHFTMRIVMSLIENPMSVKSVMVAWEWE